MSGGGTRGPLLLLLLLVILNGCLVGRAVVALRAQSARDNDGFLGCLAVVGPMSLYGFVTNTHLKFIIALRSSGPHDYKDSTVKAVRLDRWVAAARGAGACCVLLFLIGMRKVRRGIAPLPESDLSCQGGFDCGGRAARLTPLALLPLRRGPLSPPGRRAWCVALCYAIHVYLSPFPPSSFPLPSFLLSISTYFVRRRIQLFRKLHAAVIGAFLNPFTLPDAPIVSAGFEARVDEIARRFG